MNDKRKAAPAVHGVNAEDFAQWKHHPVTKALHRYLDDYRAALLRDHIDRWEASPQTNEAQEAEARGRCISAREFKDIGFDDLAAFYSGADDETHSERSEEEDARAAD